MQIFYLYDIMLSFRNNDKKVIDRRLDPAIEQALKAAAQAPEKAPEKATATVEKPQAKKGGKK